MKPSELRIGDRIRIVGVPGKGVPNYYIHRETVSVYKKLMARRRSVRIYEIDKYGTPWFRCRFKTRTGQWGWHFLGVFDNDQNWVAVVRKYGRT
jgi:hypothetical protein